MNDNKEHIPSGCAPDSLECGRLVKEMHEALLGGTFKNPIGLVHKVQRHEEAIFGRDDEPGLIRDVAVFKEVRAISKVAYIVLGGIVLLFGSQVAAWCWRLIIKNQ